jgi:tRNA-2-methylthio-N6-dimethylallyladenosine synthase
VKGLQRIRFTTSHPKDLCLDLIRAFGTVEKLCRHIHLPVQSGSNSILKRMNRKYTREIYLQKVDQLRRHCPDIAITSDFIVGFPGETETDYLETLDLIRRVGFDGLFAFMYSDRPHTESSQYPRKVAQEIKHERLSTLLDLQESITSQKNESTVGSIQTVLVDGPSKQQRSSLSLKEIPKIQWCGRTSSNKIVNFIDELNEKSRFVVGPGELVDVSIERAFAHSLWGKAVDTGQDSMAHKGGNYAA